MSAKCTKCKSEDIFANDSGEFELSSAYCLFHCEDCGHDFTVYYTVDEQEEDD